MTVDHMIRKAIDDGLLVVDTINGKVFSKKSGQIREIKPESNRKGYHRFSFYIDGQRYHFRVNRVVFIAEYGEIPEGFMIDHINNDKNDNRVCNLQMLTNLQNIQKSYRDRKRKAMKDQMELF